MPRSRPIEIMMSARAVVAIGQPFVPRFDTFFDAGVARDEISDLRSGSEPLVLRVVARGGSADERDTVAGDWLCGGGGSEPVRVWPPAWAFDRDSRAWSKSRPLLDAWEGCEDARWSLRFAADVGVDQRTIVRAACACARGALRSSRTPEAPSVQAINAAEAWANGAGSERQLNGASRAAAVGTLDRPADEATRPQRTAAALVAEAAYFAALGERGVGGTRAAFASQIARVASYAADAEGFHGGGASALRAMADTVREYVPTLIVLRAAVAAA